DRLRAPEVRAVPQTTLLLLNTVAPAIAHHPLSLHDALPIYGSIRRLAGGSWCHLGHAADSVSMSGDPSEGTQTGNSTTKQVPPRSEEHTSELQSLAYLVCRLLLEKKKK